MQASPQVGDCVQHLEPLYCFSPSNGIHKSAGIVVDITLVLKIATAAGFPEAFISHPEDQPIKDGLIWTQSIGHHRTQVQVDNSYPCNWCGPTQALSDNFCQAWKVLLVFAEKIYKASFIYGDQASLIS